MEKAKDSTCWVIRKSCVDVLIEISELSSDA
jgi:hypothetical protein